MGATSENTILIISGLCGIAVFWVLFKYMLLNGKSRNQRIIEERRRQGYVTTGRFKSQEVDYGDPSKRGTPLGADYYKITYSYFVNGVEYEKTLGFEGDNNPGVIQIYYDPENPKNCIAGNEATKNAQQGKGCLITLLGTLITIGLVSNVLEKIFLK